MLFLDDCKDRTSIFRSKLPSATLVSTVPECLEQLRKQAWDRVFLDHDLGGKQFVCSDDDDCGFEVVREICREQFQIGHVIVHSHNFRAAAEMTDTLERYGYRVTLMPFLYLLDKEEFFQPQE